jgi:glycine/D-amino acid oxidase-like deaminating enzyme
LARNLETNDALVIGAGAQGCITSVMLAEAGWTVTLVDSAPQLLAGASGKMEGWLHHGTYHAALAHSVAEGRVSAADCLEGAAWFRRNCPDSLLPSRSIAVTTTSDSRELEQRWAACGVSVAPIRDLSTIRDHVPVQKVSAAYTAEDMSISVPGLRRSLQRLLAQNKVQVLTSRHVSRLPDGDYLLTQTDSRDTTVLRAALVVVATGTGTTEALDQIGMTHDLHLRLWRSHLLAVPRLPWPPLFFVDYGLPSVFPQGEHSLIGVNSDNQLIHGLDDPALGGLLERFEGHFREFFRAPADLGTPVLRECLKVDVADSATARRAVRPFVHRLGDRAWVLLPGKLTTAPVAAHQLVSTVTGADDMWSSTR